MKTKLWNFWVLLHWLMAALVIGLFLIGQFRLNNLISSEQKMFPLSIHVILGNVLFLIVLLRLALRRSVIAKPLFAPPSQTAKTSVLDRVNAYSQPLLYMLTIFMSLAGIGISIPAGLYQIIFARTGATIPVDFNVFPARSVHVFISILLTIFVIVHILVFIEHQFLKKENYIKKMWFISGRKK